MRRLNCVVVCLLVLGCAASDLSPKSMVEQFPGFTYVTTAKGPEIHFSGDLYHPQLANAVKRHKREPITFPDQWTFPPDVPIRINGTQGGMYRVALEGWPNNPVIIDGECHSACLWMVVFHDNVCFTDRVREVSLHAPQARMMISDGNGNEFKVRVIVQAASEAAYARLREPMRSKYQIASIAGGSVPVPIEELRTVYADRRC